MKQTKQCPLVMIEWMDSVQPQSRWTLLTAVGQPDGVRCVSVGWLVADTKRSKSVAPNMGAIDDPDSLQVSGVITIPSRCILKVTKLKEPSVGR